MENMFVTSPVKEMDAGNSKPETKAKSDFERCGICGYLYY